MMNYDDKLMIFLLPPFFFYAKDFTFEVGLLLLAKHGVLILIYSLF